MDFPHHAEGKRVAFAEQLQAVLHGINVAGDFRDIIAEAGGGAINFVAQEIGKRRLGALDLGGEDGFFPDVGIEEKPGIRQKGGNAVKPAYRGGCGIQQSAHLAVHQKRRIRWEGGAERRRGRFRLRLWWERNSL